MRSQFKAPVPVAELVRPQKNALLPLLVLNKLPDLQGTTENVQLSLGHTKRSWRTAARAAVRSFCARKTRLRCRHHGAMIHAWCGLSTGFQSYKALQCRAALGVPGHCRNLMVESEEPSWKAAKDVNKVPHVKSLSFYSQVAPHFLAKDLSQNTPQQKRLSSRMRVLAMPTGSETAWAPRGKQDSTWPLWSNQILFFLSLVGNGQNKNHACASTHLCVIKALTELWNQAQPQVIDVFGDAVGLRHGRIRQDVQQHCAD